LDCNFLHRDGFLTDCHKSKSWTGRNFVMRRWISSGTWAETAIKHHCRWWVVKFTRTIAGAECECAIEMIFLNIRSEWCEWKKRCHRFLSYIMALFQTNSSHKGKGPIRASSLRKFCWISKSSCQWIVRECELKISISILIMRNPTIQKSHFRKLTKWGSSEFCSHPTRRISLRVTSFFSDTWKNNEKQEISDKKTTWPWQYDRSWARCQWRLSPRWWMTGFVV
jgi:hypothetical protein